MPRAEFRARHRDQESHEEVMRLIESSPSMPCKLIVYPPGHDRMGYTGTVKGAMHWLASLHVNLERLEKENAPS